MTRRALDAYYTPAFATQALIREYPKLLNAQVCEPCAGSGHIADAFRKCWAYDIDPHMGHGVADARTSQYSPDVEAFVTNPPFNQAFDILVNLHMQSKFLALFLRLSFLEPTKQRGDFLAAYPPGQILVLPRISFTGDGKTDSVTCAWMIWRKEKLCGEYKRPIKVITRTGEL